MPSNKKHAILIVDDHAVVRMGLSLVIGKAPDMQIAGESADGGPVMEMIARLKPAAVVLDLTLKDVNGLQLLKEMHSEHPSLPVLVLSMHEEMVYAERALRAGALGYVHKEEAIEKVVVALRDILAGKVYAAEQVKAKLLRKITGSKDSHEEDPILDRLSDRELDVFRLIGQGMTTRAIAEKWHRSVKTIETYRANIKRKLDLDNSVALVREAVEWQSKSPR
jgi:DNA-binding NarL/FixJ family response regulator